MSCDTHELCEVVLLNTTGLCSQSRDSLFNCYEL